MSRLYDSARVILPDGNKITITELIEERAMKHDFTPKQLDEILRRVDQQLVHDAAIHAVTFGEGLRHYALRQILHYADEVAKEDGKKRRTRRVQP